MFTTCVLVSFEKDFKLLQSLIAFGTLLDILGPKNWIDCWQTVNLCDGEIKRLLLLVEMPLDFE